MAVDAELGRASVDIRAKLDKLDGDLDQARGKVSGAISSMVSKAGQSFQQIGQLAMLGIGGATAAVAGLGAALAKITIDAAPVEGISMAFEGLAESAGVGADEMLAALQRGSAGMISQRDLMMSFNKAAQLVGKDFAVQLPDAMQYLGKVAAATGQDMDYMMQSLVIGVGRMSPMILDNLGIQVKLSDATERASEMYGLQADELSKAQLQAGMMSVVLEKLQENTASMPDVTETATAKMAQFKARIQDTKDRIGMALLPVLKTLLDVFGNLADKIIPIVVKAVEGVSEVLSSLIEYLKFVLSEGDVLNDWLSHLPGWLRPIVQGLGEFVVGIKQAIQVIKDGYGPFEALMEILDNFLPDSVIENIWQMRDAVAPLVERIVEWFTHNLELKDVLITLGIAIGSVIIPAIISLLSPIIALVAAALVLVKAVSLVRNAWESDWGGIRTALTEAWENTIKPALITLLQWLSVNVPKALETLRAFWVDTVWPAIQAVVQTAWAVIQVIFNAIKDFISGTLIPALASLYGKWVDEVWPAISNALSVAWSKILPVLQAVWDWLMLNVPRALENLRAVWVDTVWPAIQRAVEIAWPIIEDIFVAVKNFIIDELIPRAEDLYATWVDTVWPAIQTIIETFWGVVQVIFTEVKDFIVNELIPRAEDLYHTWVEDVWPAIQTAIETVWGIVRPIWETIHEWLETKLPQALETTKAGFNTAMSAIQTAVQTAKGIWDTFTKAIHDFADWINNHIFKFHIDLPKLPDWMIPGSPLPIHKAWMDFARDMDSLTIRPRLEGDLREGVARYDNGPPGLGNSVIIYGLTLYGVRDARGLLDELQDLAI
jgi:phage-related protein